nr:hypothetical protein [uncultured Porphyromonas sp.]
MPKHIKALKCPQCGSTRATLIREDHYRCDSCSTEFFLDSDDITIHHKHETDSDPFASLRDYVSKHPKQVFAAVGGVVFLFLLFVVLGGLSSRPSRSHTGYGAYESGYSRSDDAKERISYDLESPYVFTSAEGRPIVLVCGSSRPATASAKEGKAFIRLYDGEKTTLVKTIEIPEVKGGVDLTGVRLFGDGAVYLILNKKNLYRLDRSTLDIKELHGEDYKQTEFSEGFAQVEFFYEGHGDALKVMTNLGKSYVYYPIPNKLYTDKNVYKGYTEKLPAPKVCTHFAFSSQTTEYEDQQIQLVRYRTLEQVGYPHDDPYFGWTKDYGGSGIFTDASPYRKVFVRPYVIERTRMQGYEDLTPGAYYFSPEVLYESDDRVLITFKPTASSDAKRMLRCLDAQTGKVLWNYTDEDDQIGRRSVVARFSGGYLLAGYSTVWLISNEGKLVSSTDYHSLIEGE